MEKTGDNENVFAAPLMDLSKAFDCLPHELIIAKLNSYGFNLTVLNLIHNEIAKRLRLHILLNGNNELK